MDLLWLCPKTLNPNPFLFILQVEAVTMERMFLSRLEAAQSAILSKRGVSVDFFDERCAQLAKTVNPKP